MKYIIYFIFLASTIFAYENQVPSCYKANKIDYDYRVPEKEFFVIIDQTTVLDDEMKNFIMQNTKNFIIAGNKINIITFSSFVNNQYTKTLFSGQLEYPMSEKEKYKISKKQLRNFSACMKKQKRYAAKLIYNALKKALDESTTTIPKSDIFKNLYQIAEYSIKGSKAKNKTVLLSSDMLENSSISSFYYKGSVRNINVKKEFRKFEKASLIADFSHSNIYVMGAGTTSSRRYRDPKTMTSLKDFWVQYFNKCNANLKEFGEPMLFQTIQ